MQLVPSTSILAAFLSLAPQQDVASLRGSVPAGKNPAELDRTGIPWCRSFDEALERAKNERRLLFLMPDNFAPTENGEWSQEIFRVGPLCDERIAALIRLRFVPFYFNTFEPTAAYDERATAFVVRVKKEFGKEEQHFDGGMPLLVMTAGGDLVGELKPYSSCDDVLAQLLRILEKNAAHAAPSAAEKANADTLERARVLLALQELDKAERLLKKETAPEALVLRARMARYDGNWKKHEKCLAELVGDELADDGAVERAHALCHEREFAAASEALAAVGDASERYDEARYLEGVALFRSGERERALAVWKGLVEGRPLGPWVYRADWAYVNALTGEGGAGGAAGGSGPSLLGHGSYAGPRNPDLGP